MKSGWRLIKTIDCLNECSLKSYTNKSKKKDSRMYLRKFIKENVSLVSSMFLPDLSN